MGCISSKRVTADGDVPSKKSAHRRNANRRNEAPSLPTTKHPTTTQLKEKDEGERKGKKSTSESKASNSNFSLSIQIGTGKSQVAAEQTAVEWPGWLTAVAGDAIQGWSPLRADSFEKLEKIGQGTYSSVFKAREHATGKLFALKKVKLNTNHPDSVRFMVREIAILRKLDHPNVVKLHGLITSKVSSSIYLVFEYMEHDLSGLISNPQISLTETQIKCFMQQLLYGLDYCHRRGVMHRDIKTSNILVNNEGVLKIADFGLANFISTRYNQPLTSRVVTLWYRPPELLLGSTNYGPYVDIWSAGCVFAELLAGKSILKGKTEVEQLHKIFKLCGSPPEEFWEKSKLPHATMFKPQARYESSLRERFQSFSEPTLLLLESLLSVDPQERSTAASALTSTYFTTMPYACDPSSMPKYPPSKEIDAKYHEESQRSSRMQDNTSSSRMHRRGRKGMPEPTSVSMIGGRPGQEEPMINRKYARRNGTNALVAQVRREDDEMSIDMRSNVSQVTNASQDMMFSGHGKSAALALAKRRIENYNKSRMRNQMNNETNLMLDEETKDVA